MEEDKSLEEKFENIIRQVKENGKILEEIVSKTEQKESISRKSISTEREFNQQNINLN